jgi:hypothetical protein
MVKIRFAALIFTVMAFAAVPQHVFARSDSAGKLKIALSSTDLLVTGIDPVVTGGRGPTVADAGWADRSQTRHRCSFCTAYQEFPQD